MKYLNHQCGATVVTCKICRIRVFFDRTKWWWSLRVRFYKDDAHIFCTPEQLHNEFVGVINLVLYVFKSLGFDFVSQVSVRDYNDDKKYIGDENSWDKRKSNYLSKFKKLDFKVVKELPLWPQT